MFLEVIGASLVLGFFLFLYFFLYHHFSHRRAKKLLQLFAGRMTTLGALEFVDGGRRWTFMRMAAGRRSFPTVWCELKTPHDLLVGHENSLKYVFLFKPKWQLDRWKGMNPLIGFGPESKWEKVKAWAQSARFLFPRDFSHVRVKSEWHLQPLPRKVTVLRYVAVSEEVYENPQILKELIHELNQLADLLEELS